MSSALSSNPISSVASHSFYSPVGRPFFEYRAGELFVEEVALRELAVTYGTPLYVYSRAALQAAYHAYSQAIGHRDVSICFGMKANSNLAVLKEFAQLGAGFDIVSIGELLRVQAAGGDTRKVVFSGVGKRADEMLAALEAEVKCFNVESEPELQRLSAVAQQAGKIARVSLRINPDVDPQTHPYISTGLQENKFGIAIDIAPEVYAYAKTLPGIEVVGVDCHIGSQITEISPYLDALDKLLNLIGVLSSKGIEIYHLDLGGGLAVRYLDESPMPAGVFLQALFDHLDRRGYGHLALLFEPGRSLVGNAGVLLTQVEYIKQTQVKQFAIVDAAMNDLLRPTLYDAYHGVLPVTLSNTAPTQYVDIVGPICESGDWLARKRLLSLKPHDLLAIETAGAYAMPMASNYNTRARAAEIMVSGKQAYVVRERERVEDLFKLESVLPDSLYS